MKLALIPPHCYQAHMMATDYHLFLPQLFRNESYCRTAIKIATETEEYCILDNGAAENEIWSPDALHIIADQFGMDEIVIPDVMGDKDHTIAAAYKFAPYVNPIFRYMAVAQGQTMEEVVECVDHFSEMPYIDTLGIPRHLCKTLGDRDARLVLFGLLYDKYGDRFQYHMLGASPLWPRELVFAQVAYGDKIRGMDTSMPYNYGYHGESVDGEMHLPRPENYFDLEWEKFKDEVVMSNVATMLAWSQETNEYSAHNE